MSYARPEARLRAPWHLRAISCLMLIAAPIMPLLAQQPTDATLSGVVRSRSDDRPVEGAIVALPELSRSTTTNARGEFRFVGLPSGRWLVTARAIGFASAQQRLTPGETLLLRLVPSATELSPVTVTTSRGRATGSQETTSSVSVLPAEELAATPASTTDELLRGIPGVQLPLVNSTANFPANPSVAIRGVGLGDNGTRTLVLVDGLPANGAFFGNVFWNRIPRQQVDRVEVVRGGAGSSLFGSYAMGGVINILTRPIEDHPHASAELKGGRFGFLQADATAGTGTGSVRAAVSGNYLRNDGFFRVAPEDRGPIDRRARVEQVSVQVKGEADLASGWTLGLTGNFHDQDQRSDSRLSVTSTRILDVNARARRQLGGGGVLTATVFAADEEFANDGVSTVPPGTRDGEFVSNAHLTPTTDLGGAVVWHTVLSGPIQGVSLGVDGRYIKGSDDADIFLANGDLALTRIGRGKQRVLGAFAEVTLAPLPDVQLVASARLDNFRNFAGENIENGTTTTFDAKTITEVNPRLGLRYQPTAALGVRASGYRAFRMPTLAELYRSFGTATFIGRANPALEAETLTGLDAGLDLQVGPLSAQFNGFYVEIENQIGGVVAGFNPFTLRNENIGTARSKGLEVLGQVAVTSRIFVTAGYTFTEAEVTNNADEPELIGNRIEGAPRHAFTGSAGYRDPDGLALTLRVRSLGEQFQDISNESRLAPHTVVDAFAAYRLRPDLQLFLDVENLLDEDYTASALGAPRRGAPLTISGGARLTFR